MSKQIVQVDCSSFVKQVTKAQLCKGVFYRCQSNWRVVNCTFRCVNNKFAIVRVFLGAKCVPIVVVAICNVSVTFRTNKLTFVPGGFNGVVFRIYGYVVLATNCSNAKDKCALCAIILCFVESCDVCILNGNVRCALDNTNKSRNGNLVQCLSKHKFSLFVNKVVYSNVANKCINQWIAVAHNVGNGKFTNCGQRSVVVQHTKDVLILCQVADDWANWRLSQRQKQVFQQVVRLTFGAECRNQIRQSDFIQHNCKVSNNVHLTVFRLFPAKNKVVDGVFVQFCNNLVGYNWVAVFVNKTKGVNNGWNSAKFDLFQSAMYTCIALFVHVCVEVLKQWRIQ